MNNEGNWLYRLRRNPNTALAIVTAAFYMDYLLTLMCIPILPTYGKQLGLTDLQIGIIFSVRPFAIIISNPFMGLISDKFGRRKPMLIALFVMAASTVLFCIATKFSLLVIARVFQGISSSANVTGGMALLADLFPSSERGKKMSIALMGLSAGVLSGAPIGGILYNFGGILLPFLLVAGLIIADAIARATLLVEPPKKQEHDQSKTTAKEQILMFYGLLKDIPILLVVCTVFLGNGFISMMEVTLPLYLEATYHYSSLVVGFIYGICPVVYMVTIFILGKKLQFFGAKKGMVLMGTPGIIILLVKSNIWFFLIWSVVGVGMACVDGAAPPELAEMADKRHPGSYGKVFALSSTGNALGYVIFPIVSTALEQKEGFGTTWLIFGTLLLVFGVVVALGLLVDKIHRFFEQKNELVTLPEVDDEEEVSNTAPT